jgi:hypothetical protein
MRIPKLSLPFLYLLYLKSYCEKHKNITFVRLSDYYLNIPLWGHSVPISLHCESHTLICFPKQHLDLGPGKLTSRISADFGRGGNPLGEGER